MKIPLFGNTKETVTRFFPNSLPYVILLVRYGAILTAYHKTSSRFHMTKETTMMERRCRTIF